MIVKVCGMREQSNISAALGLGLDMMGFIQYPPSPRYAPEAPATVGVKRVGVFVNEDHDTIIAAAHRCNFDTIQLHGSESRELCCELRKDGYRVIKAISVATAADIERSKEYVGAVDLLLFDTKCEGHGGSGRSFDWSIIDSYKGETPFLLSGGIDATMAEAIKAIRHPQMAGIDLNSRFEISPGVKDIERLEKFINEIR